VTARRGRTIWIEVDFPGKKRLTESEAIGALKDGPEPKWFEPWAERGVVLADITKRYGYVHVLPADEDTWTPERPHAYDMHLFDSRGELAYALQRLHNEHPLCPGDDCLGLFYFTPDQPIRLYGVVELDEDEEAEA